MENYRKLAQKILDQGFLENTRSGSTMTLHGEMLKFDLQKGFPLLTTKYINFDHIKHETLWYLKGTDKITYLKENNINIWNAWADENDSIGPTYGVQWRNFEGIDQLRNVILNIMYDPSRRMIVNGWNPIRLNEMKLPPCLVLMQFHTNDFNNTLDMTVYQRSADYCLGVPYDIAEMALLNTLVATTTEYRPGELTMFYGNIHIYTNHISTLKEQLKEEPQKLPSLIINRVDDIDYYKPQDIELVNYKGTKKFRYPIAV